MLRYTLIYKVCNRGAKGREMHPKKTKKQNMLEKCMGIQKFS
jgi:hypothetical protein